MNPWPYEQDEPTLPPLGPRPLLIATDYDGTLAPIVGRPEEAWPQPGAREVLQKLLRSPLHEVWVVTGRRASQVHGFLGLRGLPVIGLHGLEWPGEPKPTPDRAAIQQILEQVPPFPGRRIEDKGWTVAIHYRQAPPELHPEIEAVLGHVALPYGWARLAGKFVHEFRPAGVSKGKALERLIALHPEHHPVFIGDDQTDEEGFAAVLEQGGTAIKVGAGHTLAPYRIADPAEVVRLLEGWQPTTLAPTCSEKPAPDRVRPPSPGPKTAP